MNTCKSFPSHILADSDESSAQLWPHLQFSMGHIWPVLIALTHGDSGCLTSATGPSQALFMTFEPHVSHRTWTKA